MTVHGNIRMERELAWLVSYYDDLSPLERAFIVESFNKVKITLGPGGQERRYEKRYCLKPSKNHKIKIYANCVSNPLIHNILSSAPHFRFNFK
jgi:hypothetical protein